MNFESSLNKLSSDLRSSSLPRSYVSSLSLTNDFISSKQRSNGYYIESTAKAFNTKDKLSLLIPTKTILKFSSKKMKVSKDIATINNDLFSKSPYYDIRYYGHKPTVNISKAILNFTTEQLLALSPTSKVVERGNIIRRIENNLHRPDLSSMRTSKKSYKANNRRHSVDTFAQGLSMGKYKNLY